MNNIINYFKHGYVIFSPTGEIIQEDSLWDTFKQYLALKKELRELI